MPFTHEEPLLFEQSHAGRCGVDWATPSGSKDKKAPNRTGGKVRAKIGLPEVSEPQVVRHFVRLSQLNYSIDTNFYPLGSCTMKHNPRLNEATARLDGFANLHPLQPESTVQGALELMFELENWLCQLTGMAATTLVPSAGAHGELCGTMVIRKAHKAKGNARKIILIPDSAHGTNPATAAMCGYTCQEIKSKNGLVDVEDLKAHLNEDVAAFMLTNPNTCGLFEKDIVEIAKEVHKVGAYFYCDGANFNAICGKVRPADLGVDVMQFNLHKTFSTPHGGGGPGSGPVAVTEELRQYLPTPRVVKTASGSFKLSDDCKKTIGRIRNFHGQFGMFVRAYTYMLSHGLDGLKQASEDAVLSANYILECLRGAFHAPFNAGGAPCMHECLLSDKLQKEKGTSTHDIAKALIDKGIHPMTVYFPLVVSGAMLIEPTESEPKEVLDAFIEAMLKISEIARSSIEKPYENSPLSAPRQRLNEVKAAREPVLRFKA